MTQLPASPLVARRDFCLSALAGALGGGYLCADHLQAQPPAAAPRRPGPQAKKEDAREPRPITLETKDGVALKAVYFPGKTSKETVPIIMLHGWKERGVVWEPLAAYFQRTLGHAVIVPDLRGHGQSVNQTIAGRARDPLTPEDLTPADMEATVWDVQACKKFLEDENNKGELNIEMLCVMGADYGALMGIMFTALDWSWPILTTGKQGQDVKGLAMLTPLDRHKRVTASAAMARLRAPIASGRLSMVIVAGEQDRQGYSDAKRMHRQLEAFYPKDDKTGCVLVTRDTNSHGAQLIEPQRRLGIEQLLANFIAQRIATRKSEFAWTERKSPLQR